MGLFGRIFKRKGKEEAPPAPAPTPTPPPAAGPPPEGKKPGLFGRLKDKVRRKPKEAPPEAPPAAPPAPPAPPGPPAAPPAAEGPEEGPEEGEGPGIGPPSGETEEERERRYANAPSSLTVTVSGRWKLSKNIWNATVTGTLHGSDVEGFLRAMDGEGDLNHYIEEIVIDFAPEVGPAIDAEASEYTTPDYTL